MLVAGGRRGARGEGVGLFMLEVTDRERDVWEPA